MKFSEIISANRSLNETVDGQRYNISIISNIMVHQSKDICEFLLRSDGINAEVTLGDYDNIVQDCEMFKKSDAVIIFWEVCNFIDGLHYAADSLTDKEFENIIDKTKTEIDLVLASLKTTPIVVINKFSSIIFDQFSLSKGNLKRLVDILNNYIENKSCSNLILIDIDEIISRISIENAVDLRSYYSSKTLYSILFYREYFSSINQIFLSSGGKAKKALIFDCDNTLWKGILGEDGFDGIHMYKDVQHAAIQLANKGVLIGLCSKNNKEDVDEVLENHPDILLQEKHIVIKKVGWENKATSLLKIAEELNIGIDSLVFVDDSSFEVGLIRDELPDVTVFQISKKSYEHHSMMNKISNLFYNPATTNEDLNRIAMYKSQIKRNEDSKNITNIDTYLSSLEIVLKIEIDSEIQAPRIAQMTQKTNQFNLTTKRYSESDILNFIKSDDKIVISLDVKDKYGSNGITGLVILCKTSSCIDTFLLSCRIIGRKIEYALMDSVIQIAVDNGIEGLSAEFIRTIKNNQVEHFYKSCGFDVISESQDLNKYFIYNARYVNSAITYKKE